MSCVLSYVFLLGAATKVNDLIEFVIFAKKKRIRGQCSHCCEELGLRAFLGGEVLSEQGI